MLRATQPFGLAPASPMSDMPIVPGSQPVAVADRAAARPGKPASVWCLQLVAVLVVAICGAATAKGAWDLMTGAASNPRGGLLAVLFAAAVSTALVLAVVGCQRRQDYGRLLGLLLIAAIFLGFGAQWLDLVAQIRQPEFARQSIGGLHAGAGVGVVMLALVGGWFYAFGFSARARSYFGASARRPARDIQRPT